MWVIGWSERWELSLSGPQGWRQHAPGTYAHHWLESLSATGPGVGRNTADPSTRSDGSASGYWTASNGRSATVRYPVSSMKRANCATVTGPRSIAKAWIWTSRTVASSG